MEENIRDTLKGIGLQFFADPPAEPPQSRLQSLPLSPRLNLLLVKPTRRNS